MSCGYACVGCGKCKGIARPLNGPGHCPACGFGNDGKSTVCKRCGMPLPLPPGATETPKASDESKGRYR